MRVLVISPTFFPIVGGAELLIRDVLNVWSERHEVRLVTPVLQRDSEAFWIEDQELDASCNFRIRRFEDHLNLLTMRGHRLTRGLIPPMSLTAVDVIEREARRLKADLLVGFFGVPYGLPLAIVAQRLKLPFTLIMCGTDLPSPRTAPVPHWADYLRFLTRRASKVVYVSRFCFDILSRRRFDPVHDQVIFGGVDMSLGRDRGRGAATVRAQLGIAPDDIMLFALQRLGPEKRVDVLVRAIAEMPELERRVRLVIGGQGSEASRLVELADDLGVSDRVTLTGYLGEEKYDYYAASDIFVFHSLFETFGQVLVEAMRAGKPIVSVRAGAIPEVVADGENGLLASAEDPADLAEKIALLVSDDVLRAGMGRASRERAERHFDWDVVRGQWAELMGSDALSLAFAPNMARAMDADTSGGAR